MKSENEIEEKTDKYVMISNATSNRPKSVQLIGSLLDEPLSPTSLYKRRKRVFSYDSNDNMLKKAMENKAADLQVTMQELEEMESLEPSKRLHFTPSSPCASPREDQSSIHVDILKRKSVQIGLFGFVFLALLYLITVSSVKEETGLAKSSVVIRELFTPLEIDSALEVERIELAREFALEINTEIRKEVERQLNLRGASTNTIGREDGR